MRIIKWGYIQNDEIFAVFKFVNEVEATVERFLTLWLTFWKFGSKKHALDI